MVKKLILVAAFAAVAGAQVDRPSATIGGVKVTAIRHGSVMLEAAGKVIYADPWSQGNFEGLPPADLILITDIHGDHMDQKAIAKIKKEGTQIVAPPEVAKTVTEAAVLRNGETKEFAGFKIEAIPMYNLKRGPAEGKVFHEKGRGNGYVIHAGATRIYIAGDTEGTPEMRALKDIDIAFVPMNLPYTMPPEEAADAVKAFKPKVVFPYHYRGSDINEFAKALSGTGIDVRLWNWYY